MSNPTMNWSHYCTYCLYCQGLLCALFPCILELRLVSTNHRKHITWVKALRCDLILHYLEKWWWRDKSAGERSSQQMDHLLLCEWQKLQCPAVCLCTGQTLLCRTSHIHPLTQRCYFAHCSWNTFTPLTEEPPQGSWDSNGRPFGLVDDRGWMDT